MCKLNSSVILPFAVEKLSTPCLFVFVLLLPISPSNLYSYYPPFCLLSTYYFLLLFY